MFSTPKKRLFELKKELKNLRRKMDKVVRIADKNQTDVKSYGMSHENYMWDTYVIITSDGTAYTIDRTTRYFPDIDFKKILYVGKTYPIMTWRSKKTNKICNNIAWFDAYDSIKGNYTMKENFTYMTSVYERFGVTKTIHSGDD